VLTGNFTGNFRYYGANARKPSSQPDGKDAGLFANETGNRVCAIIQGISRFRSAKGRFWSTNLLCRSDFSRNSLRRLTGKTFRRSGNFIPVSGNEFLNYADMRATRTFARAIRGRLQDCRPRVPATGRSMASTWPPKTRDQAPQRRRVHRRIPQSAATPSSVTMPATSRWAISAGVYIAKQSSD